MSGLEINRELVLSTAHVSEDTMDWLRGDNEPPGYENFDRPPGDPVVYGALVYTLTPPDEQRLPPELPALLALARDNDCKWLRLDSDGDTLASLPTFDW